jgi:hypothetical protein
MRTNVRFIADRMSRVDSRNGRERVGRIKGKRQPHLEAGVIRRPEYNAIRNRLQDQTQLPFYHHHLT